MSKSSSTALNFLLNATSNPKTNLEQNIHEYVEGLNKQILGGMPLNKEESGFLIKLLGINDMQNKNIIWILFLLLIIVGPILGAILGTVIWIILGLFYEWQQYWLTLEYTMAGLNFCFLLATVYYDINQCKIRIQRVAENKVLVKLPLIGKLFKAGEGEITEKADMFALEKTRKNTKSIETASLDDFLNK